MVILVDTNVVLDIIQGRKPYCEAAADIFTLCAMKKVTGYIALHSVSNIFFILRKSYTVEERRKILKDIERYIKDIYCYRHKSSKGIGSIREGRV